MGRKKKEKKPAGPPKFPERVYAYYYEDQFDTITYADGPNYIRSFCLDLNTLQGDEQVGEYVLVRRGTTRTILEIEEED